MRKSRIRGSAPPSPGDASRSKATVDLWHEREVAEHVVQRLAGVLAVTNLIDVVTPIADRESVREEIEEALERRAARTAKHLQVSAHDGVVTLTGTVRSWPEKLAVLGAARFTRGVSQVIDDLRIVPDDYARSGEQEDS